MIYNHNEEEPTEPEEGSGEPFGSGDDEDPLVGLIGEITEAAAQQVAVMLLSLNDNKLRHVDAPPADRPGDVEFLISSAGGSISEMFTIYDLMTLVKRRRDIATFGYGKIASAAVPLLAAGTPGKRYIAKHARIMLHHCSSHSAGPAPNIRSNYNELKKVEEMMVQTLADHSKLSAGEIYNILSRNTDEYFSAEDALEMGIVDEII